MLPCQRDVTHRFSIRITIHDTVILQTVFVYQVTTTIEKMTTSTPSFEVDFTTLVTEFQNTSNPIEESSVDGNERSLNHDEPSEYNIIVALAIIGVFGVLSNVAVLAVLLQKRNRKLATNRYLINIAISEYTTATSSTSPSVSTQPLPHQHRHQ